MKSTLALLTLLTFAGTAVAESTSFTRLPANASKLSVDCAPPKMFTGLSASISGDLDLKALPNGAAKATGKLKIVLHDARNPWTGSKTVMGQYDDLTSMGSERYFHGGTSIKNSDDIMEIYVNYTRPNSSFITYAGKTYTTSCK